METVCLKHLDPKHNLDFLFQFIGNHWKYYYLFTWNTNPQTPLKILFSQDCYI